MASNLSDFPTSRPSDSIPNDIPAAKGYHFPAEFHPHTSTWLSWPHKEASWPGKIDTIFPVYAEFIKLVAEGELVIINVVDDAMKNKAIDHLHRANADL